MKRTTSLLHIVKLLSFLVGTLLLFNSCNDDEMELYTNQQGDNLEFYLQLPSETRIGTRSEANAKENKIHNLWILAFDKDNDKKLKYVIKNKTAFTELVDNLYRITLAPADLTAIKGKNYKLVALANCFYTNAAWSEAGINTLRASLNSGAYIDVKTEAEIAKELLFTSSSLIAPSNATTDLHKWPPLPSGANPSATTRFMPMWGELNSYGYEATNPNTFKMLRMLAKIVVKTAPGLAPSTFKIENVYIRKYNRNGVVIPQADKYSDTDSKVTGASLAIADGDKQPGGHNETVLKYKANNTGTGTDDSIYIHEVATEIKTMSKPWAPTDDSDDLWRMSPCVIVEGKYNGSETSTFYRLDFLQHNSTTHEEEWLDVLRNHRYEFLITGVKGPGYSSLKIGSDTPPNNMDVTLYASNELNNINTSVHGSAYLTASHREIALSGKDGEKASFTIRTNLGNILGDGFSDGTEAKRWTRKCYRSLNFIPSEELTSSDPGYIKCDDLYDNVKNNEDYTMSIWTGDNMTGKPIVTYFVITKLSLSITIKVTIGAQPTPYVGAFWRANQVAERLIRMPLPIHRWEWEATVVEGESWIWMDTQKTKDKAVTWNLNTQEKENGGAKIKTAAQLEVGTDYKVTNGSYKVSGSISETTPDEERYIYFRIGLKSKHYDGDGYTVDPRYGVVLLTYRNLDTDASFQQRIWIRQGEAPDFLYERAGDASNPPNASKRFSAFNLSKPLNKSYSSTGVYRGAYKVDKPGGTNAAVEALYPSQAGSLFKYIDKDEVITIGTTVVKGDVRVAYHPYTDHYSDLKPWSAARWVNNHPPHANLPPALPSESQKIPIPDPFAYWSGSNGLGSENETCPKGYRRPVLGSTDTDNSERIGNWTSPDLQFNTEVHRSLCFDPKDGERTADWGYYADGFFDRRAFVEIEYYTSSVFSEGWENTLKQDETIAVATEMDESDIAYIGQLIYNEETNASLFFPACGTRESSHDHASTTMKNVMVRSSSYKMAYWSSTPVYTWEYKNSKYEHTYQGVVFTLENRAIAKRRYHAAPIRCVKIDRVLTNKESTTEQ
ncbi:hypothetical protein [Bacteroides sp. 224]|uniref:hypothetical protein n=1 Tax=Bacteroides sp. 224 TaxID=2302936 RepID=UPI0013D59E5B|nr:hypothetical protein [Bacteroides sp. 224]